MLLVTHFGYVISARSIYASAFTFNPFGNPWLLGGIGLAILLHGLVTYVPALAAAFRLALFPSDWWPLILMSFFPVIITIEMDKAIRKSRLAPQAQV